MHNHAHTHESSVGHAHGPADFGRAFAIGIGLNVAIVILQAAFGIIGNSVALLADAGHNLSDVMGLLIAYGATILVRKAPTERFTYGLRSSSILAALFNAIFLLVVIGGLSWEAVNRFFKPQPVSGEIVMIVAGIGILVNGFTAFLFASGRNQDLNIRGAYLHMLSDAAVSAGVVLAGLVILATGWLWVDPLVSLAVNGIIIWGTWSLLRESLAMSLNAVPPRIELNAVRQRLASLPGVARLHDLHIWSMSTTESALTAHLVMPAGHPGDAFLTGVAEELNAHFGIGHVTLQIETDPDTACVLEPGCMPKAAPDRAKGAAYRPERGYSPNGEGAVAEKQAAIRHD